MIFSSPTLSTPLSCARSRSSLNRMASSSARKATMAPLVCCSVASWSAVSSSITADLGSSLSAASSRASVLIPAALARPRSSSSRRSSSSARRSTSLGPALDSWSAMSSSITADLGSSCCTSLSATSSSSVLSTPLSRARFLNSLRRRTERRQQPTRGPKDEHTQGYEHTRGRRRSAVAQHTERGQRRWDGAGARGCHDSPKVPSMRSSISPQLKS
jgi:hypothetical protein